MNGFYVIGIAAAAALFVADSILKYRTSGRISWWWFLLANPSIFLARRLFANNPKYQFSPLERRIVKVIVRATIALLILSILWMPGCILAFQFLDITQKNVGLVVWPTVIGLAISVVIFLLRWYFFLSGQMPGDREKE